MCIYSTAWIMAEKRYLAQLKKSEQAIKANKFNNKNQPSKSADELLRLQQTVVPLKVRLFYVN